MNHCNYQEQELWHTEKMKKENFLFCYNIVLITKNGLAQETTYLADKSKLELFDVYAGPKHITRYPNGDIVFHTVVVFLIEEKYCEKLDVKLDRTETQHIEWFTLEEVGKIIENNKCFSNNIDILEDIIQKFTIQYETNPGK